MNLNKNLLSLSCLIAFTAIPFFNLQAKITRPPEVDRDLTKEIDFERISTFVLGPTGAHGWMVVKKQMTHEARQILITQVEEGSPASGNLQDGDVILGVGGKRFTKDARKTLGWAIVEAEKEKNEGRLQLTRWRPIEDSKVRAGKEEEIVLELPVRGSYSNTAPYNCKKSETEYQDSLFRLKMLATQNNYGRLQENLLALMSTGDEECMEIVKDAIHKANWAKPDVKVSLERGGYVTWGAGMYSLILIEYYMLTGDTYVLPAIREYCVKIALGQSGGGLWGHKFAFTSFNDGKLHGRLMGYGAVNLAGLPCLLSMVLVDKCGINHPEITKAKKKAMDFFADFVGRGTIGYGYHRPSLDHYNAGKNALGSNGKNAIAALVFAHAKNKKVAQYYAKHVASLYDEHEFGHAGNSFQRFWGPLGIACGGPEIVAAYNKEVQWYNALCRSWDGRALFQKMGGWYGGVTLNLDASKVLSHMVTKRHLYITGKGVAEDFHLSKQDVSEAIKAGRWHWIDHESLSADEMIKELDCWSPYAREWIAEHLAKKEGDFVTKLIKGLGSESADVRAGSCTALGYLQDRAELALPQLIKCLSDKESIVQVAAAYALAKIGPKAEASIPAFLKVITKIKGESPLEPVLQAMAYALAADRTFSAPLYMEGLLPQFSNSHNPLEKIDRKLLYPALKKLISSRSGRIRDCGASMFRYLSKEDVIELSQDIYQMTISVPPDFGMFASRVAGHGIDVMAKHGVEEGVDLSLDFMFNGGWGGFWRVPHHLYALQNYGSVALPAIPQLENARLRFRSGEGRKVLLDTIKKLKKEKTVKPSIRFFQVLESKFLMELAKAKDKKQKMNLCHRWIKNEPEKWMYTAIALKYLYKESGDASIPKMIKAMNTNRRELHDYISHLSPNLCRGDLKSLWLDAYIKSNSTDLKIAYLKVLARSGCIDVVRANFISSEEVMRIAAFELANEVKDTESIKTLFSNLSRKLSTKERNVLEKAIAELSQNSTYFIGNQGKQERKDLSDSLAKILVYLGDNESLNKLKSWLKEDDFKFKEGVLLALAEHENPQVSSIIYDEIKKSKKGRFRDALMRKYLDRIVMGRVVSGNILERFKEMFELAEDFRLKTSIALETYWLPSKDPIATVRSFLIEAPEGRNQTRHNNSIEGLEKSWDLIRKKREVKLRWANRTSSK